MAGKFIFCSLFFSVYALCLNVSECVSFLQLFGPLNQQVARLTLFSFFVVAQSVWVCWCFHSVRRLRVYVGCFRVYFHLHGDNNNIATSATDGFDESAAVADWTRWSVPKNHRQTPFRDTIPCRQPATLFALVCYLFFDFVSSIRGSGVKILCHKIRSPQTFEKTSGFTIVLCFKNCHREFHLETCWQSQADEARLRICTFPGIVDCQRKLFTTELW